MAMRNQSNRAIINIDTELSHSTLAVKYCIYRLKSIADRDADPKLLIGPADHGIERSTAGASHLISNPLERSELPYVAYSRENK